MSAGPDAVRRARAYLLRVAEPPAPALIAFVDRHGPMRAAELVAAGEVPPAVAEETRGRREHDLVDADFAAADQVGARLVIPEDDEWPIREFAPLAGHRDRRMALPVALWVRGSARLDQTVREAICVAGARAATSYGEYVSAQFGYDLSAGHTVAAGLGYGIEAAAHRGALAAEGVTVAVLACGVDIAYPALNADMIGRIIDRGLIISEYPPSTPPARHRFAVRSRLLASLTRAAVIVEAGPRSGARAIAAAATLLDRPVMAVPGPITSTMSSGCHELLRTGTAVLVTSVDDILDALSLSVLAQRAQA
jgi:DNA processing protein